MTWSSSVDLPEPETPLRQTAERFGSRNDRRRRLCLVTSEQYDLNEVEDMAELQNRSCKRLLRHAAAIVALGELCLERLRAGGKALNPTGATPISKLVSKPVINVPGCPPIADVMMAVVTHILVLGQIPDLDSQGRPKEVLRSPRTRHLLSPPRTTTPACSSSRLTTRTRARATASTKWAARWE